MNIRAVTIRMQSPVVTDPGKRRPVVNSTLVERLLSQEEVLRRSAYKNTTIRTGASFFDDSDMRSVYYIVVVYDKKSMTPLLSARYYFEQTVIDHYLKGDDGQESVLNDYDAINCLHVGEAGTVFLADRLSGNTENALYVRNRNKIFLLFYWEIFRRNKTCKLVLMARKAPYERLLTKYLRLGFMIIGSTRLRGKEHWIVSGDLKEIRSRMKKNARMNSYLLVKLFFCKPTIG